ncbi:MAG: D-tyrosyl-tRNA(Tyr) deacylase [Chloroflexi bacterium ADurb.Bin120]|jgi:D-tyrosyl-tRNA(Tyr) deacylase|uniref:D-aminoacyl-tRNA deacylase n=1 Tax=Candidatus Brevifilum fermentans TaxID=1986204 RepID=A0A1Y6K0P9_9CHLR|nr:D-aminoacyl-tRNA deacylase [Brevefilum fermentans]OQB84177.1 MAG: D-tyrosyl-tRNA(Tyr) deacylase [Chloroflexi bacterium ADurb.Bin120]SMX53262.1 D-tyrosyl-tRNA(Tyr) deacylase [Brevefilum fermentans]HOM66884.1 D-aminoacyl-tRNA deacylase [Brevefilum fermentans]
MKAVIQRVSQGRVTVDGQVVAEIGKGLVILLGVAPEDTLATVEQMTEKIAHLRIFEDDEGKMNLSALDVDGEAIVVSQFTLYADTRRGRRPSFIDAAKPEIAEPLVEACAEQLSARGIPTQTGVFGAHMDVALVNVGPVTILLEY